MIERGIIEALHGAKPGSKQELNGQALLSMLKAAEASGFNDPKTSKGLVPTETSLVLPKGATRLPNVQTFGMSNEEMEKLADSTSTTGLNVADSGRKIIKRAPIAPNELLTLSPFAMKARTMVTRYYYPTTEQIWEGAKEFGDRVTAEAMLQIAIKAAKGKIQLEKGQSLIGIMEPVVDWFDRPTTLYVQRLGNGLWLRVAFVYPDDKWHPDQQFVISSRKSRK